MKHLTYLALFLSIYGCTKDAQDIQLLNGYWEIKRVEFQNGQEKSYEINEIVEHFKLNDDTTGTRQKVRPLLDGSFETTTSLESFTLTQEDGTWIIHYETKFDVWQESITTLTAERLDLLNEEGRTYSYKRYKQNDSHEEQ